MSSAGSDLCNVDPHTAASAKRKDSLSLSLE
jgi:hypothetical protein